MQSSCEATVTTLLSCVRGIRVEDRELPRWLKRRLMRDPVLEFLATLPRVDTVCIRETELFPSRWGWDEGDKGLGAVRLAGTRWR